MTFVVDSSLALSWYFHDEQTEAGLALFARAVNEGAVAVPIWTYEIANVLQLAVRRRRVSPAFRDDSLADLSALGIKIDADCDANAWTATVRLAERHSLTVYDASYLELALRRTMELGTLDVDLAIAARAEMVSVIGV